MSGLNLTFAVFAQSLSVVMNVLKVALSREAASLLNDSGHGKQISG